LFSLAPCLLRRRACEQSEEWWKQQQEVHRASVVRRATLAAAGTHPSDEVPSLPPLEVKQPPAPSPPPSDVVARGYDTDRNNYDDFIRCKVTAPLGTASRKLAG
jgi:hypothetical protein